MSLGQPAIKQIQSPAIWSPRFYLGKAGLLAVDHLVANSKGPESHILKDIWVDLKRGLLCATGDVSEEILAEQEAATIWERRDFFWEGYAVGLGAVHALTFSRGNPERRSRRRTGFRGMLYTGYGYWNGVAARYFLPRLSMDPEAWSDIPDFAQSLPIEIGGEAFTRVMLERQITAEFFRSFEQRTWIRFRRSRHGTAAVELYGSAGPAISKRSDRWCNATRPPGPRLRWAWGLRSPSPRSDRPIA